MIREIVYTHQAWLDLRNIYLYISNELHSPGSAAGQTQRIMKGIRNLSEMPERFRLYDDEPWHSRGLRFVPVDHYLIFYLPKESIHMVNIVRIIYEGRDIKGQLSEITEY